MAAVQERDASRSTEPNRTVSTRGRASTDREIIPRRIARSELAIESPEPFSSRLLPSAVPRTDELDFHLWGCRLRSSRSGPLPRSGTRCGDVDLVTSASAVRARNSVQGRYCCHDDGSRCLMTSGLKLMKSLRNGKARRSNLEGEGLGTWIRSAPVRSHHRH